MHGLDALYVKIFADGADKDGMFNLYSNPLIKGLTTNPTLMRKAGIQDYETFARDILKEIKDKPISFEVFSDEFAEMKRQALKIRDWQKNVFVKIPITNSRGESSIPLIRELASARVQLNVTAILTLRQVRDVAQALHADGAGGRFRLRRSHRRYGQGSVGYDASEQGSVGGSPEGRTSVGECSGGVKHLPGR